MKKTPSNDGTLEVLSRPNRFCDAPASRLHPALNAAVCPLLEPQVEASSVPVTAYVATKTVDGSATSVPCFIYGPPGEERFSPLAAEAGDELWDGWDIFQWPSPMDREVTIGGIVPRRLPTRILNSNGSTCLLPMELAMTRTQENKIQVLLVLSQAGEVVRVQDLQDHHLTVMPPEPIRYP